MTQEELFKIIAIDENYRIELTTSTGNMDKFQEAICAFANDMPGSRKKGYLLIGVRNDGEIDGDALMKKIYRRARRNSAKSWPCFTAHGTTCCTAVSPSPTTTS